MQPTSIDCQVADLAWCLSCGLRAGYSLRELFAQLALLAPQPSAAACRQVSLALDGGQGMQVALDGWQEAYASAALKRLAEVITEAQRAGGYLPEMLDALEKELLETCGSDPAFYPLMRDEATQLIAKIPARAWDE